MEYLIKQYALEAGALEIQYIEEYFGEFPGRKTAAEIIDRLKDRESLILMTEAPLPDEPGSSVPVSYKVVHEIRAQETSAHLCDLVGRLAGSVRFDGRRILYSWLGGTRRDWRGQGHFRALTEESEVWAMSNGFEESRREDEESLLRHASRARPAPVQRRQARAAPARPDGIEGVSQQAAAGGAAAQASQHSHGRSGGMIRTGMPS